ncbi:MAG: DUF5606 domain-containing protein [Bacteroidales bacterium]|nr:DUF5606 domain-containing protein [Bacteroidales bacterium]
MKTDLARILSVSGQHGLFKYVAQARNGAIAESLESRKRVVLTSSNRISSLADIAIFTSDEELRLDAVFTALKGVLGEEPAPCSKSASDKELIALFKKAIPNYDEDRFYVSHMRKVVDWYNQLSRFASLDFMTDEEREAEAANETKE